MLSVAVSHAEITVSGSTTGQRLAELWASEFNRLHQDYHISVNGGGSENGILDIVGNKSNSFAGISKETRPSKQILILASYNPGMKWEDSIDSAIRLHFAINDPSAVISIEYMDTKRIEPNQTRLDALKSLYIKKYNGRHFDLIMASNTDAFNFLIKK